MFNEVNESTMIHHRFDGENIGIRYFPQKNTKNPVLRTPVRIEPAALEYLKEFILAATPFVCIHLSDTL